MEFENNLTEFAEWKGKITGGYTKLGTKETFLGGKNFENAPGKGMGVRGQQNKTPPTASESATQAHSPTGGVTPIGDGKGPGKKINDNVISRNKREVTKKYGSLDTYDRPNLLGRFVAKGKSILGMQDNADQIGRGIETADLFSKPKNPSKVETSTDDSIDEAKNNKKEKFVTSEKKK